MSIKVGGIDIATSAINAELRIGILERIVERLAQHTSPGIISQDDIEKMKKETFEELKKKYPDAGLKYNDT